MPDQGHKISTRAGNALKQLVRDQRSGREYKGVLNGQQQQGNQCILAKLLARSGTDARRYSWEQRRGTSTATEAVAGGLTGTTSARSAYDLSGGTADLTNTVVTLVRQSIKQADSSFKPEWVIISGGGGDLPTPQYPGELVQAVTGNQLGAGYLTLVATIV
jgi:hypothetical protein